MKAKYFADTDTLLVNFSDKVVMETRDLNEDVLVELDKDGHVVCMTIEHAGKQTNIREFSYELASPYAAVSAPLMVREGPPAKKRRQSHAAGCDRR